MYNDVHAMGAPLREWFVRLLLALGVLLLGSTLWYVAVPFWLRVTLLASLGAILIDQAFRRIPAFDPLGRIRWRLPAAARTPPRCAITFDDGPSASTAVVLDILAAEGVTATFFVLGANVERHPALVRRAHAEGHTVGIHGMDHMKLTGAGEAAVDAQVGGVTRTLQRLGLSPAPVYRTPHGFKSRAVFAVARRHGLTLWAWSRGIWDTDRPDAAVLTRRATRLARPGMVLLLHDARGDEHEPDVAPMVAALPSIIRELKRRGFAFVRLADV